MTTQMAAAEQARIDHLNRCREILKELVAYGYTWLSVGGRLPPPDRKYLAPEETQLLQLIHRAEKEVGA